MLRGTKRFQDKELPALLDCLRAGRALPLALWSKLQKQFCSTDDLEERLWQPLWLDGHEISIYWETISRWIPRRVRRDAQRLDVPVLHVQARDDCSNIPLNSMDEDTREHLTERFLTKANIGTLSFFQLICLAGLLRVQK